MEVRTTTTKLALLNAGDSILMDPHSGMGFQKAKFLL